MTNAVEIADAAFAKGRQPQWEPHGDQYGDPANDRGRRESPALPPIHLADITRWDGIEPEPIEFVVSDLYPRGMVTLLPADGGAGKSLMQQMLLTGISSQTVASCFGRACINGAAAGIFAEDPDNVLHIRQNKINRALGLEIDQLAGRLFIQSYCGMDASLWADERATPFMDRLESSLSLIPDLALVTLDNGALLYRGDESDRNNVTAFMNRLNGMAERLKAAFVLSVHTSKSSDDNSRNVASGSTAWVNAARAVTLLKPATKDEGPLLRLTKANHAKPGLEIRLKWEGGVLLSEDTETGVVGSIKRRNAERVFLDILVAIESEGRTVSEKAKAGNFAPRLFSERPDRQGYTLTDFKRAMETLFAQKKIRVEPYGRPGDKREKISQVKEASDAVD